MPRDKALLNPLSNSPSGSHKAGSSSQTSENNEQTCAFCLESIADKDACSSTNCAHVSHKVCLLRWLRSSRTCASCRKEVRVVKMKSGQRVPLPRLQVLAPDDPLAPDPPPPPADDRFSDITSSSEDDSDSDHDFSEDDMMAPPTRRATRQSGPIRMSAAERARESRIARFANTVAAGVGSTRRGRGNTMRLGGGRAASRLIAGSVARRRVNTPPPHEVDLDEIEEWMEAERRRSAFFNDSGEEDQAVRPADPSRRSPVIIGSDDEQSEAAMPANQPRSSAVIDLSDDEEEAIDQGLEPIEIDSDQSGEEDISRPDSDELDVIMLDDQMSPLGSRAYSPASSQRATSIRSLSFSPSREQREAASSDRSSSIEALVTVTSEMPYDESMSDCEVLDVTHKGKPIGDLTDRRRAAKAATSRDGPESKRRRGSQEPSTSAAARDDQQSTSATPDPTRDERELSEEITAMTYEEIRRLDEEIKRRNEACSSTERNRRFGSHDPCTSTSSTAATRDDQPSTSATWDPNSGLARGDRELSEEISAMPYEEILRMKEEMKRRNMASSSEEKERKRRRGSQEPSTSTSSAAQDDQPSTSASSDANRARVEKELSEQISAMSYEEICRLNERLKRRNQTRGRSRSSTRSASSSPIRASDYRQLREEAADLRKQARKIRLEHGRKKRKQ